MSVVVFDPAAWLVLYPQFVSTVSGPQATAYFNLACYFCDNTDCSPVPAGAPTFQRDTFLNLLTAHLAQLYSGSSTSPVSPLVGRISNAVQGSVSVAVQLVNDPSEALAFYSQTPFGLAYWTASDGFRRGFYVAGPMDGGGSPFAVFPSGPGFLNPWDQGWGWP